MSLIHPLAARDVLSESATQELPLGTKACTKDGRVYRYAQAGASGLSKGELQVTADVVANHENMAVAAAAAAGAFEVTVTLGATAVTSNQYAGSYLVINDADGEGTAYLVSGHPAADASADVVITLAQALDEALTTSSEASLIYHDYAAVQQSNTDQADVPVGIPNIDVTASYFFWCQSGGACAALADETLAIGSELTIGSSTAGSVEVKDAVAEPVVGVAKQAGVDTEFRIIDLRIDC